MNAQFTLALEAAGQAAGHQDYPLGTLYMVATPIGNLADISLRGLHVLHLANTLACEDTRHSQQLVRAYGIDKSPQAWLAVHQHNEAQAAVRVIELLGQGQRVAYLSDAGTPGVSDPGARLAFAVRQAGLRVCPLPGASSLTAAISAVGLGHPDFNAQQSRFQFLGFLGTKTSERLAAVERIQQSPMAFVVLEAPHRIATLAKDLSLLGQRPVSICRELTKQHENIATLSAMDLPAWFETAPERSKGEFVVVVHGHKSEIPGLDTRVLALLLAHLPVKTAARLAAEITGQSKNALYEAALNIQNDPS